MSPASSGGRALAGYVAVGCALTVLGASTTVSQAGESLQHGPQVAWQPPLALVVAIWTALFLAQAVAAWLVQRRRTAGTAVGPALQLWWALVALEALWLALLLLGVDLWVVLGVIALTDLAAAAAAFAAWRASRLAGVLLTAATAWLVFGTALSVVGNALRGL